MYSNVIKQIYESVTPAENKYSLSQVFIIPPGTCIQRSYVMWLTFLRPQLKGVGDRKAGSNKPEIWE